MYDGRNAHLLFAAINVQILVCRNVCVKFGQDPAKRSKFLKETAVDMFTAN